MTGNPAAPVLFIFTPTNSPFGLRMLDSREMFHVTGYLVPDFRSFTTD